MSKGAKIWLIVAAALVLVGCIVFALVMTALKWNFSSLSTTQYETNEHTVTESFSGISVNTDTAKIEFIPSESTECKVVCYEQEDIKHTVEVVDGTLTVKLVDSRRWYKYIGFNFSTPKITVYMPQGEYGALIIKTSTSDVAIPKDFAFKSIDVTASTGRVADYASATDGVKIRTTTGDVLVEGISASAIDISVTTGRVTVTDVAVLGKASIRVTTGKTNLTNVTCESLKSNGSTGDITLNSVIVDGILSVERDTGDVRLEGSDAAEIYIETDTGDVTGSLLTEKVFIVETDTGRKEYPYTNSGGRCEITTDTGDIKITIE